MTVRPMPRLSVMLTQFLLWRANVHDAYDGNSEMCFGPERIRPRAISGPKRISSQPISSTGRQGHVSYNHFFPGEFIRQTGPAHGSDYVYGALQFTF